MTDSDGVDAKGSSQTVKALLDLRELLLTGELAAGQRVSEIWAVDRLGVSRTPVRAALARLQEEGFLEALPSGGYAVKTFTEQDALEAIEIRGALEGLAARLAAERGVDAAQLDALDDILTRIDPLTVKPKLSSEDFALYVRLNEAFHAALAGIGGGTVLARQIERAAALPFAHPSGFVMAQSELPQAGHILAVAHEHHRCVVEAIRNREGARAEALMREHARLAARNLRLAFENQKALGMVAGARLIRGGGIS